MPEGKLLARARERLEKRREENEALRVRREREAYARVPGLRETEAQLRALLGEVIQQTGKGGGNLADIQRRSAELCTRREELLRAAGLPGDYLDNVVTCRRCGDRGYLRDGSMCSCLAELYEAERRSELSSALKLGEDSFADFRLDYYTGAARECMELTLDACKTYAVNFGPDSPNLLFQGGTGLGKTFLSGCVARVVSGRGFSVAYETAQGAFSAFEDQKFSRDGDTYAQAGEKVRRILSCDLLILDDLGTELTTNFTQSALYNIVNTRLTRPGKKTLISTNLSDAELAARYLPQIASRIGGEFDTLPFMGRDIRSIKKELRYR